MALQKDYVTIQGVTANYHKVTDVRDGFIEIAIYFNKASRDSEKAVLEFTDNISLGADGFTYTEDDLKVAGKSPTVLAYEFLKTSDAYSGAVDV